MVQKAVDKSVSGRHQAPFARTFIKQWREYRTLTQEQLAVLVSNFLRARGFKKGYTQIILEALADSLGTDPPSLLIRDPNDPAGIWTLWEKAVPEQRATITEHAEIVMKTPVGS